ncbi:MAG: pirin family protein, partial [Parazoarcus communis]
FLQIWIQPDRRGVEPRYAQQDVPPGEGATLLVSPDGRDGSLSIHQNAFIHLLRPAASGLTRTLHADRTYYVHAVHGTLTVNGVSMSAGDGMTLAAETALTVSAQAGAEALLFDLP